MFASPMLPCYPKIMPKGIFNKERNAWVKPEEALDALKKRSETGGMLTGAEKEQLNYLENALKEQKKRENEIAQRRTEKTPMRELPETAELRRKADTAREEERKKFQGGQYL